MATLSLVGFEAGDATEAIASGGTFSVQGTTKRTGQYALRCNPASSTAGYLALAWYSSTGTPTNIGRTAETFYTFYVRFEDIPSGTTDFALAGTASGSPVARLRITSAGVVTLVGSTTSATVATLSADTWYRFDVRVTSNGTCGAAVDGGTEQTCTGNNLNQDRLYLGRFNTSDAVAFDAYYDDVYISDSGFPGAGEVRRLDPDGDGTYTAWASGSGTTFAVVDDDVPGHDGDASHIKTLSTGDNTARTFTLESSTSASVTGTIKAALLYAIIRSESIAGSSLAGLRARNGSTDVDSFTAEWSTTYSTRAMFLDTDPNGGGAWTSGGLDTLEIGVFAGTIAQAQVCTKLALMVWCEGDTGPVQVDFAPVVNAAITASASVSSIPLLAPVVNAPVTVSALVASKVDYAPVVNAAVTTSIVLTTPALLAPVVNAATTTAIAITSIPLLAPAVNAAGVASAEILSIPLLSPMINADVTVSAEVDSPGAILFAPVIDAAGVASIALVSTPILAPTVNASGVAAISIVSIPLLATAVNAAATTTAAITSIPLLAPIVNAGAVVSAEVDSPGVVTFAVVVNAGGVAAIDLRSTPLLAATVAASGTTAITLTSPALLAATILAAATASVGVQSTPLLAPTIIGAVTTAAELLSTPLLPVTILGSASVEAAVVTQVEVLFDVAVLAGVTVTASVVAILYVAEPTGGVLGFDGRMAGALVANGRRAGALRDDGRRAGVKR